MKRFLLLLTFLCCLTTGYSKVPPAPVPPRLVNDFSGMLTASEQERIEADLVAYDDSTSTQICVVILDDLGGEDILQLAYAIGESWGVGGSRFSNGVVLLIKNKTSHSDGEMAIATGYGTEGALTDALCRRIIENDLIVHFRHEAFYEGIHLAVTHIREILNGEGYEREEEEELTLLDLAIFFFFFVVCPLIIIWFLVRYGRNHPDASDKDNGSAMPPFGGSPGHGTFGGFSSRGGFGSSSGSGHSFGGFGGGHFGGGGARGRW